MIELEKWEYELMDKISSENCTDYNIKEEDGKHYIDKYDLMTALEETQDYREYADEKVIELSRVIDSDQLDELVDRCLRAEGSYRKAKKRIKELEENIEVLTGTFNEDYWDKAFERGYEL